MDTNTVSTGPQHTSRNRAHRGSAVTDPGQPTARSRPSLDRVDSQSDPGDGYAAFSSAAEPRDVEIQNSRPYTRRSTTSRTEAGHSYAETSSTTQSYVSMDSRSGPTDTPHHSTQSVERLPIDDNSDDDEVDNGVPSEHSIPRSVKSGDDTIRQPIPNTMQPTLQDIVRQSDSKPSPIRESPQQVSPPAAPFPSTQNTRAKPEFEPSRSAKPSTIKAPGPNNTPLTTGNDLWGRPSTSSRRESTATARPRVSNATPPRPASPPVNHIPPPTEPQNHTTNSPRIPAAPAQPPEKNEPDHSANGEASSGNQQRPLVPTSGINQADTQYVNMLLALDGIPQLHNIMAGFFTWILLAGFVLFPGTFTSLQESQNLGGVGSALVGAIQHLPLFIVAWICTGVGAIGMCWLWYRWQANYIWLVNRIFLPGTLNSLAGVVSTLASVLGVHHATFSTSSKSTIIVTGGLTVICGLLTVFYMFFLIRRVKKKHDEEMGKQRAGKHGEGIVDLSKRKVAAKVGV